MSTFLPPSQQNLQSVSTYDIERVSFKYIWTTKVLMRQLNDHEAIILHVSPKFATVYGQVAFQWSLQIHGTTFCNDKEEVELKEGNYDELGCEPNYIALSLYYNDGPAPIIDDLQAIMNVLLDNKHSTGDSNAGHIVAQTKNLSTVRGKKTELTTVQRFDFSNYIKKNIGQVVHLSIMLSFPAQLFEPSTYLSTLTPIPITSFLMTNYRRRASSKVFKRSLQKTKLLSNMEDNLRQRLSPNQQNDLEETFNLIINEEKELCLSKSDSMKDLKKCEGLKNELK